MAGRCAMSFAGNTKPAQCVPSCSRPVPVLAWLKQNPWGASSFLTLGSNALVKDKWMLLSIR